ncbi:MAG: 5-formyltetrahydrofolate cyclo-ligase [Candidatus Omnitrophica bacterium]|nr:5-formyltetrahydrofolate cyclo-ligase [Candidatus Omnitrophota bacterium]
MKTTLIEKKAALRAQMTRQLAEMTSMDREAASARMRELLWKDADFLEAKTIFCYVSMPEEPDTRTMIHRCLETGRRVCVPRVVPGAGVIEARELKRWDGSFAAGSFGILEPDPAVTNLVRPAEVDCVIVPGLAFDHEGFRLGRGKGYYDRFIAALNPRASRIALAFAFQCVDRVPREAHDQKVTRVLSA